MHRLQAVRSGSGGRPLKSARARADTSPSLGAVAGANATVFTGRGKAKRRRFLRWDRNASLPRPRPMTGGKGNTPRWRAEAMIEPPSGDPSTPDTTTPSVASRSMCGDGARLSSRTDVEVAPHESSSGVRPCRCRTRGVRSLPELPPERRVQHRGADRSRVPVPRSFVLVGSADLARLPARQGGPPERLDPRLRQLRADAPMGALGLGAQQGQG